MNILVTNDDGIASPGLWKLAAAMNNVGKTIVVAPDKEQSNTGTSVSLRSSTSVTEAPSLIPGVKAYAVGGTPNDCVTVGLRYMRQEQIDMLVSGINYGANVGWDIPYSGTVMATLPGYLHKIPSMAVSLAIHGFVDEPRFDVAASVAELLAISIKEGQLPTEGIFNVNVPNIPIDEIKGILVTKTAPTHYIRSSGETGARKYSASVGKSVTPEMLEGTDIGAVESGYISITPLRLEVTHHDLIPRLREGMGMVASKLMGRP